MAGRGSYPVGELDTVQRFRNARGFRQREGLKHGGLIAVKESPKVPTKT